VRGKRGAASRGGRGVFRRRRVCGGEERGSDAASIKRKKFNSHSNILRGNLIGTSIGGEGEK